MRIVTFGAVVALLTGCSQEPAPQPTPEPSAAAIEAGLPAPGTATQVTQQVNAALAERLDLSQGSDGEDARRDRLAYIEDEAILAEDGSVVWSIPQFEFLDADAPETVAG